MRLCRVEGGVRIVWGWEWHCEDCAGWGVGVVGMSVVGGWCYEGWRLVLCLLVVWWGIMCRGGVGWCY